MQGDVGEEGDFKAEGHDLVGIPGARDVLAAGTEVGEDGMRGARQFESQGDQRTVEFDDGDELNFEAEVHGGWREGASFEYPASALVESGRELRDQAEAVPVAVRVKIEGLGGADSR